MERIIGTRCCAIRSRELMSDISRGTCCRTFEKTSRDFERPGESELNFDGFQRSDGTGALLLLENDLLTLKELEILYLTQEIILLRSRFSGRIASALSGS